ncbi:MbtH family protein [Nonomuraea zeae]|uniref:MbtH family protein n=1 Tax=Nonomuraea zeae TaxID=1642303 RepID=A0A5S4FX78_9ACTN|nr:MbtH family protein [Nonomuraea zeae]TMR15750.1 MbtH family protein [Nonomuraea zeae]
MTTNPFEDEAGYSVLVNEEGQHSLWPEFIDVPAGWTVTFEGNREDCLNHINETWVDMRPRSLVRAMNGQNVSSK